MQRCACAQERGTHFSSSAQRLDLSAVLPCFPLAEVGGEGGMVKLLDVICGITGFDRGEQTSLSVTDGRTPKTAKQQQFINYRAEQR